jgi:hypothetical protein
LQAGNHTKSLRITLKVEEILPLTAIQYGNSLPTIVSSFRPMTNCIFPGMSERWITDIMRQTGSSTDIAKIRGLISL